MSRVYFTDRDLGKRFPAVLLAAGLSVERHADHFPHDCPDEIWLREVAQHEWIAVTHDRRIRYKPNERAAVVRHKIALLVVVGAVPFADLAHSFVNTQRRIEAFLDRHQPPLIAKVYRPSPSEVAKNPHAPGNIALWYPK